MKAVQLVDWGTPPQLRDVPDPEPVGEELLLRVDAAGLCRSDLHVMDSPAGMFDYELPLTLGHEVAGTVVGVGPDADPDWIGDAVVVHGIWSCGICRNCRRSRQNYCLELRRGSDGRLASIGNGLGRPGGLAEFMTVPSEAVLVRTGTLGAEQAAPLADAALTAYHAIRTNSDLIDAETVVLVIGIGGLGHLALQILRSFGVTRIVAVDARSETCSLALKSGAQSFHETVDSAAPDVVGMGGADLVLDFVGAPGTAEPAAGLLASGGRLVVVGSAGGRVTVGKDVGMATGWHVGAPFWGTRDDLERVVALAQAGALHAEVTTFPLTDAPLAYQRLRSGDIAGRAVLTRSKEETAQ
ncbi:oxidoreductase [Rhodococcoides trifolii]|uniref:alcohol dehydrogenase n=1 Tax=Rhodococcoides trifolii TaxID=908250 RepID=A0A917G716_9NOCA|nr:NAD(P)-dependent alcohol dehydrogenase [Rhodococcus trifolii]GGG26025.1 oxidoreductase [Rhodococcus trifolii]